MIGFHPQNNVTGWLEGVARLPDNSLVKAVTGAERLRNVKQINSNLTTWYRWVAPHQNLAVGNYLEQAREWFARYVDDTFKSGAVAPYVDLLQEPFNEYHNNGHNDAERKHWEKWTEACAQVWDDYRTDDPRLAHIRLVLGGAGVGNDLTLDNARVAVAYDCLLDSHSYTPMANGEIMPDSGTHPNGGEINCWKYYDGRFSYMDEYFIANGYRVPGWALGEGGPVRDASPWWGNLQPNDGWRHSEVCNQDVNCYLGMIDRWLGKATQTRAYKEGRLVGMALFTTGGGSMWAEFETKQPEMNTIADYVAAYDYPPIGEPPDPDPDPPICEGLPREQYKRRVLVVPGNATKEQWLDVCAVAYDERQTVTGSYDDAGIGALDNKTAILYDIPNRQEFIDWYAKHYPGTVVEFRSYPGAYEIIDIVDELPKHPTKTYNTRSLDAIDDLIIHHTVSPDSRTSEQIAVYHVNTKDWPGIAYHFVIGADGGIEQTNRLETISYHARDANGYSVSIALKGDFTSLYPTDEQIAAAAWLVDWLQAQLSIEAVYGHREAVGNATSCPGDTWPEWRDRIA